MRASTVRRGVAALSLIAAVTAGAPLQAHASGGSGCTSGQWTVMSAPALASDSYLVTSAAFSATDVWAAGNEYQDPQRIADTVFGELFEHWDGTSWTTVPGAGVTGAVIEALAGTSSSNLWAVGSIEGEAPLIEHWNGSAWKQVSSPLVPSGQLLGAVAVGASDVWAVGSAQSALQNTGFVEHWNGREWSVVKTFDRLALYSAATTGAGDVWIAAGSVTEHWDGSAWTQAPTATTSGGDSTWVTGLTMAGTTPWASGYSYSPLTPATTAPDAQSWNGTAWTDAGAVASASGSARLGLISAASATDMWTVGGLPSAPIAAHWDGTTWTSITPLAPSGIGADSLYGVSALPGQVWAVGQTWDDAIQREQPLIETYCA